MFNSKLCFLSTAVFAALLFLCELRTVAQQSNVSPGTNAKEPVKEIGLVKWGRDFSAAQATSSKTKKPILLMFQEVPGCQGCLDYGEQVLSHPLIVEAAEDLFVPSLVYNSRKGQDEKMLKQFNEQSWNYPVARYLDASGKDLIPRKDKIWEVAGTARRMVAALEKAERAVPDYLRLMAAESSTLEKATFAMHCYWEGEAQLGSLDGVVGTHAAWLDGKEVVEVEFDPAVIEYAALVKQAKSMKCASNVYTHTADQQKVAETQLGDLAKLASGVNGHRDAKQSDQKYYLRNSPLRFLPLTENQAVKINAALSTDDSAKQWLSPRQSEILKTIEALSVKQQQELAGMMFPSDESQLASYQTQLLTKLEQLHRH